MWVAKKLRASGVDLRRSLALLAATVFVALLASIGPLAERAFAVDAIWRGTELVYLDNTYQAVTAPPNQTNLPNEYEWRDSTTNPVTASVLYFPDNPGTADSATLITYRIVNNSYAQPSSPSTINVTRDLTVDDQGTAETRAGTTCDTGFGVGWFICPISNYLADGVDRVYGVVEQFLEVQTISDTDNGVYDLWKLVRSIANAAFILVFLAIIYSQITGMGYSNHNIKDMVPRLIVGAVLVNVSFWIVALAVDASNLMGYSIQSIMVTIRENIPTVADTTGTNWTWGVLTSAILAGAAWAGAAGIAASAAGGGISLSFLLIAALIPAAFAILVAFVILAARQAIIVVLTIISPLAFVAFVLPSTQGLFDRWRKSLTTLLLFFPIFALLFGGSQVAGTAIINTSVSVQDSMKLPIVLMGLATQVVPLIITPLLIRFSSGLLGQIANMTNSSSKGLVDRARNWATDNAETHKARKLTKVASDIERRKAGERINPLRARGLGRYGYSMKQKQLDREKDKKQSEDYMGTIAERRWNRRLSEPSQPGALRSRLGMSTQDQVRARAYEQTHHAHKQSDTYKDNLEANADRHWNSYITSTDGTKYRDLRRQTHVQKGANDLIEQSMVSADELALQSMVRGNYDLRKAKRSTLVDKQSAEAIEKSMTAGDQKYFDRQVANNAAYNDIRTAKVSATRDSAMSQHYNQVLESEGKREFQQKFVDGSDNAKRLRTQKYEVIENEKVAGSIENTIKSRGEARFERISTQESASDFRPELRTMRLEEKEASDSLKVAEKQWEELIERVRVDGAKAAGITSQADKTLAGSLKQHVIDETAASKAAANYKAVSESRAEQAYIESADGFRESVQAQSAKDILESAKLNEAAAIEEWRSETGAENLTGEDARIAAELRQAEIRKRTQTQRSGSAKRVTDLEYSKLVRDDSTGLAVEAGGIEGPAGVSQAQAVAFQTIVESFNKGVAAEKTLLSKAKEDELLGAGFLGSDDILDQPSEHIAAIAGTIAGRQHQLSHIKLWNRMGELQRIATAELDAANASGDAARIQLAEEKVDKVKDMQQQVMGDKAKTPFGAGDADQGDAKVGRYSGNIYESTRFRLDTHISGAKLAGMDPDDLRLIFEMAREGKLNEQQMLNVAAAYDEWRTDDNLKSSIENKHRFLLDPFMRYYESDGDTSGFPPQTATAPEGTAPTFWKNKYDDIGTMSAPS